MKSKNNFKGISIFQVALLIISIFAIAWVIGSSIEVVSAEGEPCETAGEYCDDSECLVCLAESDPPYNKRCVFVGQDKPGCTNENVEDKEEVALNGEGLFKKGMSGIEYVRQLYSTGKFLGNAVKNKNNIKIPKENNLLEGISEEEFSVITPTEEITRKLIYENAKKTTIAAEKNLATAKLGKNTVEITKATTELSKAKAAELVAEEALKKSFSRILGTFFGSLAAAATAAFGYAFILEAIGVSGRNVGVLKNSAYYVTAATALAVTALYHFGGGVAYDALFGWIIAGTAVPGVGWISAGIALVTMAVVTLVTHQDYSQEIFTYQVQTWQPPEGGDDCLKCNALRYGCSEYQCHSFGQSCGITNKGTSDEKCVWINKNDILPPELTPIDDVLRDGYIYTPAQAVLPNERGVRISYQDNANGCIPPFTNITLGVATNEPASCKIDIERKSEYDELMSYMVEGALNVYDHTLPLPSSAAISTSALEHLNLTISNDNEYLFFIRCKDVNGNPTTSNFLMEFCVDQGPDTMAPVIEGTSFSQNSYVSYNKTNVPLEVYTNEPADCKWDFQDLDYDKMNNNMTGCSQVAGDYFRAYSYGCLTNLTGIQNNQANNYYIKCEDQPWFKTNPEKEALRNENKQPYVVSLTGTSPLIIDEVLINDKPNNSTIKDATDVIKATLKIKTLAGAEEGKARCAYGIDNNFIYFYNNGVPEFLIENTQPLWLVPGDYNYSIRCEDLGGNVDYANAIFTIEKDTSSPEITRVYREQDNLKLITHEAAQCVYSSVNCNYAFEDGSEITTLDSMSHFIAWDTEINYYVKCKDKYGNEPVPQSQCSIVVRGSEYISG